MFCLMVLHLLYKSLTNWVLPLSHFKLDAENVSNLTEFVVSGSLNTHPEAESRNLTGVIRTYTPQSTPLALLPNISLGPPNPRGMVEEGEVYARNWGGEGRNSLPVVGGRRMRPDS
ncbi:hypothetical protein CEXT_152491 [Caerostris extrusa]|uniref:Uncharacterized protein n=1 Tax=Caerostris extrusa TaxID=172846 RepID=A0AAV4N133_CAEEX|nr:hypothetical protein CEXT_152491 [Caerostris extrusa]